MRLRICTGLLAAATAALLAGCSAGPSAQVPSLASAAQPAGQGGARPQPAALHAAAQCIRDHGVPGYQDPVVDPNGNVYSDLRSLQVYARGGQTAVDRLMAACGALVRQANFNPASEPRATPALVQAGVRAAECLRAHGLPNYRDPTPATDFVPGHGFQLSGDELPPGGKTNGTVQQALQACRTVLDQEDAASSLASLSHG